VGLRRVRVPPGHPWRRAPCCLVWERRSGGLAEDRRARPVASIPKKACIYTPAHTTVLSAHHMRPLHQISPLAVLEPGPTSLPRHLAVAPARLSPQAACRAGSGRQPDESPRWARPRLRPLQLARYQRGTHSRRTLACPAQLSPQLRMPQRRMDPALGLAPARLRPAAVPQWPEVHAARGASPRRRAAPGRGRPTRTRARVPPCCAPPRCTPSYTQSRRTLEPPAPTASAVMAVLGAPSAGAPRLCGSRLRPAAPAAAVRRARRARSRCRSPRLGRQARPAAPAGADEHPDGSQGLQAAPRHGARGSPRRRRPTRRPYTPRPSSTGLAASALAAPFRQQTPLRPPPQAPL
jgi:hypothetical protein